MNAKKNKQIILNRCGRWYNGDYGWHEPNSYEHDGFLIACGDEEGNVCPSCIKEMKDYVAYLLDEIDMWRDLRRDGLDKLEKTEQRRNRALQETHYWKAKYERAIESLTALCAPKLAEKERRTGVQNERTGS